MIKTRSIFSRIAVLSLVLGLGACSNMDDLQQRVVSGGAIGVVTGAVATAATGGCIACGIAIGGAVGAAGGYIVHELDANTRSDPSPSPSSSSAPPPIPNSYNSSSNDVTGVPQGYPAGGYQN